MANGVSNIKSIWNPLVSYNKISGESVGTSMQEPQSMVINEVERDSNPILKVLFNKIRNLRKKHAQIEHIKTLDQKSLKPPQIAKLSKEQEVVEEIHKNEEFARYYKAILIENNLGYQKVDDLLKISTLIAVGKRIEEKDYCPKQVKGVYEKFYGHIVKKDAKIHPADEVIRIYHLLWEFLEDDCHYSQCRDYMTYLQEIDERMKQEKPKITEKMPLKGKKGKHTEESLIKQMADEINKKLAKLKIDSEVFKISLDFLETQTIDDKDIDLKQECSTTNPEGENDFDNDIIDPIQPQAWLKKQVQSFEEIKEIHSSDNKAAQSNPKGSKTTKNRERRHRKNKKAEYVEPEFNVRKCSDTSLEPTPEKHWAKVKYMEKKW